MGSMIPTRPSTGKAPGILLLFFLWIAGLGASIWVGNTPIRGADVWEGLFKEEAALSFEALMIREIRLPRALTASAAGAALAVSGLLLQTIFRNPLADPFVLGLSAGASLGVGLVVLVTGVAGAGFLVGGAGGGSSSLVLVVAASMGAGASLGMVLLLSVRLSLTQLLIAGLMISYLVSSILGVLMFYTIPERLQAFFIWSYGSFESTGWERLGGLWIPIGLAIIGGGIGVNALNAIQGGEAFARSVGVSVNRWKYWNLIIAALLAGTVTAFCGPIGFIGVAVPHLCRALFQTNDLRILYPATAFAGALVALLAAAIAVLPGSERVLPLNAVTALIGAPVIVWFLLREGGLRE